MEYFNLYKQNGKYGILHIKNNQIIDSNNFKNIKLTAEYIVGKDLDNLIIETKVDELYKLDFNEGYSLGRWISTIQFEKTKKKNLIKKD